MGDVLPRDHLLAPVEHAPHVIGQRIGTIDADELFVIFLRVFGDRDFIGLTDRTRAEIGSRNLDRHNRRRRRGLGIRKKHEVGVQPCAVPGGLLLVGGFVDQQAHLLEHLLDRQVRGARGAHERRRIGAVLAKAVEGDRTGSGRISDQRAFGRVDQSETAIVVVGGPAEGVVAAGIDHDQARLGLGRLERGHDIGELHALLRQVVLIGKLGVDRDQVVFAVGLDAVAGVIDHRDGVVALFKNAGRELFDRLLHDIAGQVERHDDLEAGLVQHLRHRLGVVHRIIQRLVHLIGGIADDQRDPALGLGCLGELKAGRLQRCAADLGGHGGRQGRRGSGGDQERREPLPKHDVLHEQNVMTWRFVAGASGRVHWRHDADRLPERGRGHTFVRESAAPRCGRRKIDENQTRAIT